MENLTTLDALREERAEIIRDIVASVISQVVPQVKTTLGADYVTRAELESKLIDGINDTINRRFDESDTASETRHGALVQQTEARFALTATKKELTGVMTAGAENKARLDKLESAHQERLDALEKRLNKVEDLQKKQSDNITQMTRNTNSIRDGVQEMQRTYLEAMSRDKKRQEDIDRELLLLKNARVQSEKEIRDNQDQTLNLRADVEGLRGDIGATVRPMQDAMRLIQPKVADLDDRLSDAELVVTSVRGVANSIQWSVKTRRGNIALASLFILFFGFQALFAFLAYQLILRIPV